MNDKIKRAKVLIIITGILAMFTVISSFFAYKEVDSIGELDNMKFIDDPIPSPSVTP